MERRLTKGSLNYTIFIFYIYITSVMYTDMSVIVGVYTRPWLHLLHENALNNQRTRGKQKEMSKKPKNLK